MPLSACLALLSFLSFSSLLRAQSLNSFPGLELFLDDQMVSWTQNLHRQLHPVTKHPANPVVRSEQPWEKGFTTIHGSVMRDAERGVFRMWYNAYGSDYRREQFLAYAESADGYQWRKPMFDLVPFESSARTNILLGGEANIHGPALLRLPDAPADQRYLLLFDSYTDRRADAPERKIAGRALYVANSPDGIHFDSKQGRMISPGKSDTGHSLIWNPERGTIQAFVRGVNEYRDENGLLQRVRYVRMTESRDGRDWSEPVELMKTDALDGAPDVQMHQMSVTRYGPIYIGLLTLFRIDRLEFDGEHRGETGLRLEYGKTDTQLVTSRDGLRWQRVADRATFLPLGERGQWDSEWLVTASEMVLFNGKAHIYYGGAGSRYARKTEIGVASVPLDRFLAWKPRRLNATGILELKPFHYPERDLVVNADAGKGGEIQAEVLDFDGNVVPGYGRSQCVPIRGDALRHALRWKSAAGPVGLPAAVNRSPFRAIRLRFYLRNAELYSLRSASNSVGIDEK
ncbi:MAG: hypothetical protein U0R19_32420 [Bryobacteraceae bacterium]